MKKPILHVFDFTKPCLREFGGKSCAWSLDLDRTLADFRFVSVFTKYIFHEPSDIARHAKSPDWISGGIRPTSYPRLLHAKLIILTQIKRGLHDAKLFEHARKAISERLFAYGGFQLRQAAQSK